MEICRLCGKQRALRNSHLFPEFLYRSVYDEQHRTLGVAPGRPEPTVLQKGLRERLLCGECEGRFGRLESYAASVLRRLPDGSSARPGQPLVVQDVEYKQFKLFQLSLIWRASVAKQASFCQVTLGPHEERIRVLLLAGDPGEPLDYPCLLIRASGPEQPFGMIKFPGRHHLMSHVVYHMIAGGLVWAFFVSSHTRTILEHGSFLSGSNELPINISSHSTNRLLRGIAKNLRVAGST